MNEHPVPRNITGFQFQLIGSMTVKQFGYLLTGIILAFVFFKLPLSFFRFPLAGLFGFIGFALAFLPIQERPLDIWIVNFIKCMYAPNQYIWKKEVVLPDFLAKSGFITQSKEENSKLIIHHNEAKNKLSAYLQSIAPKEHQLLNAQEMRILQTINTRFSEPMPVIKAAPKSTIKTYTAQSAGIGLISGIVKAGPNPVSNILITIKDQTGKVVRILKSNAEGKFGSSMPLPAGIYEASFEDPKKTFTVNLFRFQITSAAFVPWLISATALAAN